jgi:hexulose-6-phosphate isomerase
LQWRDFAGKMIALGDARRVEDVRIATQRATQEIDMFKAVNYWTFGPKALPGEYPIVQAMQEAKAAGYEGIELCIGGTGELTFKSTEAQCKDLAKAAKKIGIKISSTASGSAWGCSPTDPKKAVREQALENTLAALQITKWLNAGAYLHVPGAVKPEFIPDAPVLPYGETYDLALSHVKAAAKLANVLKVDLLVENVWNSMLYSPVEMRDFIRAADSKYVGQYFDPANVVKNGYAEHWVPVLGKLIKRVHCKDYVKAKPTFPEGFAGAIGAGDTPWKTVLKQLKAVGYKGPITVEMITFEPVKNLVKDTSKQLSKLMKGL